MQTTNRSRCPGCQALLPVSTGATHRYIGASPACWAIFSALLNAGEPPIAPTPASALLGDAYAAQHPGTPSPQAIQSVAVHLITLYGVFERGVGADNALWIRRRALRDFGSTRKGRFEWLTPPSTDGSLTVADVAQAPAPADRAFQLERYVRMVWDLWAEPHGAVVASWYDAFVTRD